MRSLLILVGKTAVVTGGSRGVGRETAFLLAEAGASVGIGYRSRADEAEETVRTLREMGVQAWAEPGIWPIPEDARRLFERADRELDGLDFFVGNAGIWPPNDVPISEMPDDQWTPNHAGESGFHLLHDPGGGETDQGRWPNRAGEFHGRPTG